METPNCVQHILEALLFSANSPLSLSKMQAILKEEFNIGRKELRLELQNLAQEYEDQNRAFELTEIAEGYLLQSKPDLQPYLEKLHPTKWVKLAPSALEVLAIIAYKQPVTRIEVEQIRGVDCSYSLSQLLERQLISNSRRSDAPGAPMLFETTAHFLTYFGLKNIKELPRIPLQEPTTPNSHKSPPDLVSKPE